MPKYRKLYVKVIWSPDFNRMPNDFTRLTWLLLLLIVSRDGTCPYHAGYLRSQLYPMRDDVTVDMVNAAMQWFERHGMIRRYRVDGLDYLQIVNFKKYQGDTSREAASDFPPPPETDDEPTGDQNPTQEQLTSNSRVTQELLTSNSRPTHELLKSYSCSDADANSNADAVADSDAKGSTTTTTTPAREEKTSQLVEGTTDQNLKVVGEAWFEARGGLVNPLDSQQLQDLLDDYGVEWVLAAIHDANASRRTGLISMNYVKSILERWRNEGFRAPFASGRHPPPRASPPDDDLRATSEALRRLGRVFGDGQGH